MWYEWSMDTLHDDEIGRRLPDGWRYEDGAIHRSYEFEAFMDAIAFINRVAAKAEGMDHHPDLRNSYTTVEVSITTHSAGGVTEKDLELAAAIDA